MINDDCNASHKKAYNYFKTHYPNYVNLQPETVIAKDSAKASITLFTTPASLNNFDKAHPKIEIGEAPVKPFQYWAARMKNQLMVGAGVAVLHWIYQGFSKRGDGIFGFIAAPFLTLGIGAVMQSFTTGCDAGTSALKRYDEEKAKYDAKVKHRDIDSNTVYDLTTAAD